MLIYNKYKIFSYINMKESLNLNLDNPITNQHVDYIFNFKKKLIRNFLFFFFLTFFINPFSIFSFNINPSYYLKLDVGVLSIMDNNCIDNFYNFYY